MGWIRHNPDRMFDFIVGFKRAHDGLSPTLREIGDGCGIPSVATVRNVLMGLVSRRLIVMEGGIARGIRVRGGRWVAPGEG